MDKDAPRATPADFDVVAADELQFHASRELLEMYKLSPYVWREGSLYHLLLRVVNVHADASRKIARIHHGISHDGVSFSLDDSPAIAPEWDDADAYDSGGCEDPTVARVDDVYYVYYSGWNERARRGELLLATGTDLHGLTKHGIALPSSERARNPKEATIVGVTDGTWRLFFEFADEDKSKIGIASAPRVDGPWTVLQPLFDARPEAWDSWHLSTGPIVDTQAHGPVMFYNGGTQKAQWRIGWVTFDAEYTRITARSGEPLALRRFKRHDDDTDIAFAASAVEVDDDIHLYYSVADQYCVRAVLRRATRL